MSVKLATAMLALAMVVLPTITTAQDTDNSTQMITGCLRKGATATSFTVTDENGKSWEVHSKTVQLRPHLGQTVTLTGTIPKPSKDSTDTTPQNHLRVTSLEMVRDSCKQE
jgi:hypothetical protein